MARRRVAERRDILPDPIYNSTLVTKFINGMMWAGKKSVAEQIFYGAMEKIGEKTETAATRAARGGKRTKADAPQSASVPAAIPQPVPIIEVSARELEAEDIEIVGAEDLAPPPNTKKRGEGKDENG